MSKILPLLALAALAVMSCSGLTQQCQALKAKADKAAAAAEGNLKKDLTIQEVRQMLGGPAEIITYSGEAEAQTWRYFVYPDCRKHLGIAAPNTELFFRGGRLQRWQVYQGPLRTPPEPK